MPAFRIIPPPYPIICNVLPPYQREKENVIYNLKIQSHHRSGSTPAPPVIPPSVLHPGIQAAAMSGGFGLPGKRDKPSEWVESVVNLAGRDQVSFPESLFSRDKPDLL